MDEAADSGDPMGMARLAACYEDGIGVTNNAKSALDWYRKAAEQGLGTAK